MRTLLLGLPVTLLVACQGAKVEFADTGTGTGTDDTATPALLAFEPDALDFGTILPGETASQAFVVRNLDVQGVTLSLSSTAQDFTTTTTSLTLGAEDSLPVTVEFTAVAGGAYTGEIVLVDFDGLERGRVSLTGAVDDNVDVDGDGVLSRDDCDDTNAEMYPGAPDAWYDGVDSDCAGNDDYDQDGDGHAPRAFGGLDCNDNDAAVSPDATDAWYDGVDSDCAGDDDFDQDGDGQQAVAYGGTDCDDEDAVTYAGAPEVWYDGVDQDCAGGDDFDQDGDGHVAEAYGGDDCLDTDALTYAGAADAWYDGVDSDCAGNDDYDQDGDGFLHPSGGGADCDDTRATTFPGAADGWYDGVDSDCAGNDDYDQDGDGDRATAFGGTDCDDLNPAFYGGAADAWYDGVDNDCAGNDDYDQDGDGHRAISYGGDDCDDTVATTYPGAVDAPYDGVDADCAGDDDFDMDGDGDLPTAYGGGDCDDTDPLRSSTQTEVCDGIDNDCDGVRDDGLSIGTTAYYGDADGDGYGGGTAVYTCAMPPGYSASPTDCDDTDAAVNPGAAEINYNRTDDNCNTYVDDMIAEVVSTWTVTGSRTGDGVGGGAVALTDDVLGLGVPTLITCSQDLDAAGGGSTYTDIGACGFLDTSVAADPVAWNGGAFEFYGGGWSERGGGYLQSNQGAGSGVADFGDQDGDGYADVVVGSSGYDFGSSFTNRGAVYVVSGEVYLGYGYSYATGYSYPNGMMYGVNAGDLLGYAVATGDMNGDGDPEILAGAPGYDSGKGRVYAFFDGDYLDGGGYDLVRADGASYALTGVSNNDHLGYSVLLADLDDDGYDDVVACAPDDDDNGSGSGSCWMDLGSASVGSGGTVTSVANGYVFGVAAGDQLGKTRFSLSAGDFDGDGANDLALGAPAYDGGVTDGGGVAIWASGTFSGAETFSGAGWRVTGDGGLGTAVSLAGDVDGDGVGDLLAGAPAAGSAGRVYLLGGGVAAGTYVLPAQQDASWVGNAASDSFGTTLTVVRDLTGDGRDEFAAGAPAADPSGTSNAGKLYVVPAYP